ncbi:MAG: DEAD/DEAH box helicase family protein, partial [Saprospiraceae bacterium]|nr:DEAD/DEAH box helicase family protein [Saprospiraceae bacterium]
IFYRNKFGDVSVRFLVNKENNLEVSCFCKKTFKNHLCEHTQIAIAYMAFQFQADQFLPWLNRDVEKNRILSDYGLSLQDKESEGFEFGVDYFGKLALKKVPAYFIGIKELDVFKSKIIHDAGQKVKKQKVYSEDQDALNIGLVFHLSHSNLENNPIRIEAFKSEINKKGAQKINRLLLSNEDNVNIFSHLREDKFHALMDFSFLRFKDVISFDSFFSLSFNNFQQKHNPKTRISYLKYFFGKLSDHWDILSEWGNIKLLREGEIFHQSHLSNISLNKTRISPSISVRQNDKFIILELEVTIDDMPVDLTDKEVDIYFGRLIKIDNKLYLHNNENLLSLFESMPKGKLFFPLAHKKMVMKEVLLPLSMKYNIVLPEDLALEIKSVEMIPAVHFREFQDKYLLVEPKFYYEGSVFDKASSDDFYFSEGEKTYYIQRDTEREDDFVSYIKSLHVNFKNQIFTPYFQLPFEEVMKNHWFVSVSKQLMERGIKLIGVKELTRFKYSTAIPKWNMNISSGIDWFDINIQATWGDELIGFRDIKKAILNGQSFVVLGDGSFGVLPEEWIKKYSFLLKIGKDDHSGNIKVSKKHFGIIDLLFDQIDDEVIRLEIEEKKAKLLNIGNIHAAAIPEEIIATLRPYQESGYQWLQVLDDVSWGGCLADDMGLGKTLQAITFLSYLKNKYNNPTSLIICPTSLIYNWESELKKFAPSLKYHIFYGLGRSFDDGHFENYDIIITSYGTARNDIETLMGFNWEYIILDESQAIKNPDANTTKAMSLLKSRNKLILTGTPLQNNTFDLYAQFNFLNPGLLGSRDFFRNEFANPIDKNNDKEASLMLKSMIRPFMLRRTKTEVAQDLPDKTEIILWCQMDKEQKSMYDEYKDYYRHALSQKIEEEGIAKSGMYILEGLLRLRQICDDPRLIKDKERKPTKGIKIKELIREVTENTGDHKMLIFSQFTEMLALIKEELNEFKLKYCYLDGSTSAINRKNEVNTFQTDESIKIFLISLKAGGVGLNLTEADYVYIVDPWWNPAVEQQAIDRTHRIGQKNNIFAYKMICKDSVEEKILLLQEKKKGISKEIITDDSAFFKKLTKDDIQFLFS